MEILQEYMILFIPLIVIQLGLMIASLIHVLKAKNYKIGNRALWVVVCLLISIIGPVLYFTIGKDSDGE